MLLHFVVISLFEERHGHEARLVPVEPAFSHGAVSETLRALLGDRIAAPQDPMWFLKRDASFIGYVRVFRNERYARNWFRDLADQKESKNFWAYWRDGHPLFLIKGASAFDANQYVKMVSICRVRAFSAESAAQNGWMNWIAGRLTALDVFLDRPRKSEEQVTQQARPSTLQSRHPVYKTSAPISTAVEHSKWQVTHENMGKGKRPSAELSRTYTLSGSASPHRTATLRIVCRLESEGLVGVDDETGALKLHRQLRFYLRPFPLLDDADFVMGLSTSDQAKGGEFDVVASPVDDDTSVIAKFGGRSDVRACLDLIMSGSDMNFSVSNETDSLAYFCLPNDLEFKAHIDDACDRIARAEYTYQLLNPNPRH